jgi:hypothetical protein
MSPSLTSGCGTRHGDGNRERKARAAIELNYRDRDLRRTAGTEESNGAADRNELVVNE